MKIIAIIQARMSSARLPGKILKKILDKEMILYQVERVSRTPSINEVIVATSSDIGDDVVEKLCQKMSINYHRGNLEDVLDRFYQTARLYQPDHVIRLTADCPLSDPKIIEDLIQAHIKGDYEYSSNCRRNRTYAHGLDTEIFKFSVLEEFWRNRSTKYEKEHVTPSMYAENSTLRILDFNQEEDQSRFRITVDHPEDFQLITAVFENLYKENRNFSSQDVIRYLENNPKSFSLNKMYIID